MDKILKNEIVFTNLNGICIIECECLDILKCYSEYPIYIDFANYYCDKVRIIELYDINKNIIDHIIDPKYNDPLKRDSIINLESFKENILFKKNFYFKSFLRAYLYKNKINNIKYHILNTGEIISFKNDIIIFDCFSDFLKFDGFNYYTNFYNNNNEITHCIYRDINSIRITYFLYNKSYNYEIEIYMNEIEIKKIQKESVFHEQIIKCNKELKILQVLEQNCVEILYEENRDINDVIMGIKKYNHFTNKLEIILSNNKSILIKSEKSFPQELLDFYNLKIDYYLNNLIPVRNHELNNAKNTLLNEIFKNL